MISFILISLDKPREQEIYDILASYKEVKEVKILFGEWDMIVRVETENPGALSSFVIDKVRSIKGIRLTSTLIAAK